MVKTSASRSLHGALMIQGTASSAGKSLLVMGLCRILANRGVRVAPFKPQNMSNNAMVAADGGEIGRAQALQAIACNLAPSHHFNPILLKPLGNNLSQLVVQGQALNNITAKDYYGMKKTLMKKIFESYEKLQQQHDVVLIEGAGSPAEVNLRAHDMANMGFATRAKCPVLLVGDIDRGGVVASLVGTRAVLSAKDRQLIKGFVINKFRGDASLFDDGMTFIRKKTGWAALGLVPFFERAHLFPDEDSLSFTARAVEGLPPLVAVFQTPQMAQSDDLAPLRHLLHANGHGLAVITAGAKSLPASVKIIVLAGSKNTIADLQFLRAQGFDKIILAHHRQGGMVVGLCGGYQMLGATLSDPHGVEGAKGGTVAGLGLLPINTVLAPSKTLTETHGQETMFGTIVTGYEIHAGISAPLNQPMNQAMNQPMNQPLHDADATAPFLKMKNGKVEGAVSHDKKIIGSYLHGLFHNHEFLVKLLQHGGVALAAQPSYNHELKQAMDDWAIFLEQHLSLKKIISLIA